MQYGSYYNRCKPGIGFSTARYFAGLSDFEIYALSRNSEGLGQLVNMCAGLNESSAIHPLVFDLEWLLQDPSSLHQKLPSTISHIDILINNAGVLINKPFQQISLEEMERIFRVAAARADHPRCGAVLGSNHGNNASVNSCSP